MLKKCPPVSNTERQRQFRLRNPGYYGRLRARRTAAIKATVLASQASLIALATTEAQAAVESSPAPATPAVADDDPRQLLLPFESGSRETH